MNEVTQNYSADNTHPTYIDRQIARELFIILEKDVSDGMDMSEGRTLWCDSDGTSYALSQDNDVLGSPVHNSEDLERGGTKENRCARIREHMYIKFRNARNVENEILYWHLKTWAKEAAMLMGIPRFKASNYFLHQFRRCYKIISRKITRFIIRRDVTLDTVVRTRA